MNHKNIRNYKKQYLFLLVFLLFFSFGCSSQSPPKYLYKLTDNKEFKLLSGNPLSSKYGEVDAIKVVYVLKTKKIYYLNSRNYKYHHGFCSKKLSYAGGLENFNLTNYSANSSQREYLLCNISYYRSLKKYLVDFSPADLISIKNIEFIYQQIISSSFLDDELTVLLNTSRLINQQQNFTIPTTTPESIYHNQKFQVIGSGKCYGYLRFVTPKDIKQNTYSLNDILVLTSTPNIIPHVSGIISSEFQTPLSHLSILGRNRDIPIMAYKGAFENSKLLKYKDQFVRLEIFKTNYNIRRINPENAPKNRTKRKGKIVLHKNLLIDSLVGFDNLKRVSSKAIGNKAKNFAVLKKLSQKANFKVPESAFAIPFYFYERHIESSKAEILIENLLADLETHKDSIILKKRLKAIRRAITESPIDIELVNKIEAKVKSLGNYKRFRFRSSTNAEDMNGFGGAGLYTSKTGIIGDSVKTVEKAIKKVWASLWNFEAFNERNYYRINQHQVTMGILVHRAFPNEIANGVAITKNIYRESNIGYVINVQVGNESVVDPKKGVVCDQVICYESGDSKIYSEKDVVEVITKSSLNNNQLIMTDNEIVNLARQLTLIKKYYFNRDTYSNYIRYGLDLEFKLDTDNRTLYIKQVRYYND